SGRYGRRRRRARAAAASTRAGAKPERAYLTWRRRGRSMAAESKCAALVGEREIRGTRVFDAPRELVWKVWTEPEHIGKWWGLMGFTTTERRKTATSSP